MTEARPLAASIPPVVRETVTTMRSTSLTPPLPINALAVLRGLPDQLNDGQYALVKEMAAAAVPPLAGVDAQYLTTCLRKLGTLPRKNDDEKTGEERIKVYARMLGDQPAAAIDFLMQRAFETCRWMPTVAECLDIMKGWKRDDEPMQAHLLAGTLSRRERQARFDAAMARLARREMTQEEIDVLPARWAEVAEARAYLWRCDCGSYVARPLPVMAEVAA